MLEFFFWIQRSNELILQLLGLQDGLIGVFVGVICHCHESQWVCCNKVLHWFWLFSHNNMLAPKDVEAMLEHFSSSRIFWCKYILLLPLIIVMLIFKKLCVKVALRNFRKCFINLCFIHFQCLLKDQRILGPKGYTIPINVFSCKGMLYLNGLNATLTHYIGWCFTKAFSCCWKPMKDACWLGNMCVGGINKVTRFWQWCC